MMKMVWIAREADENSDEMRVFFDRDNAESTAWMFFNHLTDREQQRVTVTLEGYQIDVPDDDDRDAEKLVNDMLIEDTFPYDPDEYIIIK